MHAQRHGARRYDGSTLVPSQEVLAHEAVLQVRVNGVDYTTTVRTPGADEALARGLLFAEGVVTDPAAPCRCASIADPESGVAGVIDVAVPTEFLARAIDDRRSMASTASCGLCGVREAKDLQLYGGPLRVDTDERLDLDRVDGMMRAMAARQSAFDATGGTHAAAAFTLAGECLAVHEDIGRHNAVDKVVGELITKQQLDDARCLTVSGRLSYEIVFKAFHARIPFLLSVSAPSSMAVEMGERFGLCVVGFCRDGRATVYSQLDRVVTSG